MASLSDESSLTLSFLTSEDLVGTTFRLIGVAVDSVEGLFKVICEEDATGFARMLFGMRK